MEEYISFASKNYLLFIALGVIITLIVFTELRRFTQGYKEVPPAEAVHLINKENALVLDIREANDRKQGNIIGAKHIALSTLPDKVNTLSENKDRPLLVFCKMGNLSAQACKVLLKNNYTRVFGLKGGITSWISEQMPITKE